MCFRVAEVVQCILSRIPADSMRMNLSVRGVQSCVRRGKHINIYHLRARIPCGVNSKTYSLPFPTSPKLAAAATAMRLSKNGEYLTAYP